MKLFRIIKNPRLNNSLFYSFGVFASGAIALISNLLTAKVLTPLEYGVLQTFLLVPNYSFLVSCGVFNGLTLVLSSQGIQSKEEFSQKELISASGLVSKAMSFFGLIIFTLVSWVLFRQKREPIYFYCLPLLFLVLVVEPFSQHIEATCLGLKRFKQLGWALSIQNAINTVGAVIPLFGGSLFALVSRCVYVASRLVCRLPIMPRSIGKANSPRTILFLVKIGLPAMISTALTTSLSLSDRTIAAMLYHKELVGQLALVGIVSTVNIIASQILGQFASHNIAGFMDREADLPERLRFFRMQFLQQVSYVFALAISLYLFVNVTARNYLPQYLPGLPAANLTLMFSVSSIHSSMAIFLLLSRRGLTYVAILASALGLNWLVGVSFGVIYNSIYSLVLIKGVVSSVVCLIVLRLSYLECKAWGSKK